MTNIVTASHEILVFGRRTRVLADRLAPLLPSNGRILDIGCGDGTIDSLIAAKRPDLQIRGVDVLLRPKAQIPVERFDGKTVSAPDLSYDAAILIDVLHHTEDPMILLREAHRVAHKVIVKDHTSDGLIADTRLRMMDWFGNAGHGVALPYNYWPEQRWRDAFNELGLRIAHWESDIPLYPYPASILFGNGLHFIAVTTSQ